MPRPQSEPFENGDRIELLRVHGSQGIGTITAVAIGYDGQWWTDVAWDNDPSTEIHQDTLPAAWLHLVGSIDTSPCQYAAHHVDLADGDTCYACGGGNSIGGTK